MVASAGGRTSLQRPCRSRLAEVGVRGPQRGRDRDQDDREPVDAYAAAGTAGSCHRPPFNVIWGPRLPRRRELGRPLRGPSLRLPTPPPPAFPPQRTRGRQPCLLRNSAASRSLPATSASSLTSGCWTT